MSLGTGLKSLIGAALLSAAAFAAAAQDCGGPEAPCDVEDGSYHVALPDPGTTPIGIILWLHGNGGSGAAEVQNRGLVGPILTAGYALVAPNGVAWPERDVATDWAVNDGFNWRRNDITFLESVIADAAQRFDLPADRVIVGGFARGGSMAWDFACARPEAVIGVAAIAGAFWEPMHTKCAGPVNLFHTHGFTDPVIPFEGRDVMLGQYFFQQGDVMKAVDVWRRTNGCLGDADRSLTSATGWEKRWAASCKAGSVALWLHPGGHEIPQGWVHRMLTWADGLGNS